MNIAILNGKVFLPGMITEANLLIEDGVIKSISKQRLPADKVINARGLYVLPGIIDCHVHMREPGQTEKEDFVTGSCSAAAGGVTTFLDMPNNRPPTLTKDLLEEKRRLAKRSVVNFGFHFGSSPDTLNELVPENTASTKVFLDESTGSLSITDDTVLEQVFRRSRLVTCHAEGENVRKALEFSHKTSTPVSICHVSTAQELQALQKDPPLGIEACPHHLFLSQNDDTGPFTLMKPRLKPKDDVAALWQAISNGLITHVASDHAPHTIEDKEGGMPPYGVPGVETMLPLLLDAVNKDRLKLNDVVRLCSQNPARIFKLQGKGSISVGNGDLTLVDLKLKRKVKADTLHSKCGWTPYEGKTLKGWPVYTIINGTLVYDEGAMIPGQGMEVKYERDRKDPA
ncbi:MAG: dihydroorotase family protein [Nanoarchaeota archaeon]|nr:dihydroorotase family protein [Nanoarchaeota archaeon]